MIVVEQPGLYTTLQDQGRPGLQHLGITPGGAMDGYAAWVANRLVGNPATAAVLEITLMGPRLVVERGSWMALTGADLSATLDGEELPTWCPVWVPAGARLNFGEARRGCRAYLALGGGFMVDAILGSRATDVRAGFGGLDGRPVRRGDHLPLGPSPWPAPRMPARPYAPSWRVNWIHGLALEPPIRLRLVPDHDWWALPSQGRADLESGVYRIDPAADRMGLRLQGPALTLPEAGARVSAGVTHGTLQLPPDGQPILLGVDRQTVGGYPVLGTVASVDHPYLAHLKPGDTVRFEPITVARAQALYRRSLAALQRLELALESYLPPT
ncbi:biotin-dependent carboxyltransferase family protein [Thermochromatium tepidum]|uniref:5-oxoprolinase/urea amidolyase family protein n=1 Tax=Thermochromatium tepidum ATCC 43061 TaxID=316276 RepID=A0A6I6EHP7_THETI|nr:biotin-dependent carboxyltransferase family protein [Thermochromatium tepidum]QGU33780.1 5-oxoprolinase/urea amidolyase family protein [Thermochromatium tepidum ATCC 43061]